MEQPYGQQPPPVAPPASPPTPPSYYMAPTPYAAPPARRSTIGRALRLLGIRLFSGFGTLGRMLRPHWLMAIVVTLLVGMIAVEGLMLVLPAIARTISAQGTQRAESIAPAPAVESFIEGQRSYDAGKIWASYSEDMKSQLREKGGSQVALETQVKQERESGQRYLKFDYVGGVNVGDGSSKFFYLVEIESPDPQHDGLVSYVFTVDPEGKIANIEMGATP